MEGFENIWTDQRCSNERQKGMMEEMRGISASRVMLSRFTVEQSRTVCVLARGVRLDGVLIHTAMPSGTVGVSWWG